MKSSGKLVLVLGAILIIGAGLVYLLWGGIEKNIVYFVSPTELLAKGKGAIGNPVRLGGVVTEGSVKYQDLVISFTLSDEKNSVAVVTTKAPPQMFQEGIGVVVEGAMGANGKFTAERLMVKHGNEYRPPAEGEMPQEVYQALQRDRPPSKP